MKRLKDKGGIGAVEIILLILIAIIIGLWISGALFGKARAAELISVKITGYCLSGTMANGEEVHEGAVAYRKADIGKTCRIYNANMELMGEFQICDTGNKEIRQGKTVDVWKPTKEECYALTQQGFIEIIEMKEETE